MNKEVICKLRIKFAKPFKNVSIDEKVKKVFIDSSIETYQKAPRRPTIYLIIEDRIFYSKTLTEFYRICPKEVKTSLRKYILEGIKVSETAIESIVINTKDGVYIIGDIMEVVAPQIDGFKYFKE